MTILLDAAGISSLFLTFAFPALLAKCQAELALTAQFTASTLALEIAPGTGIRIRVQLPPLLATRAEILPAELARQTAPCISATLNASLLASGTG